MEGSPDDNDKEIESPLSHVHHNKTRNEYPNHDFQTTGL
jgi:hypothetical protein